jgi:glycosyltransferase involved in cell wall biosynthesis
MADVSTRTGRRPLSVVVVAYEMSRELPRTLRSLAPDYQRGIGAEDYEVVLVDNGSKDELDAAMLARFPGHIRATRIFPAPPSPAHAANVGLSMAEGDVIGLMIDGARMASPGLLAHALLAARLAERPVIATLAWHLGPTLHMQAAEVGYDQDAEDRLLAEIDWKADGYRLFEVSTLAASSRPGWFSPLGESSALFLNREMWSSLGGLDERFEIPGGGRVNHDIYRRACSAENARLIVLLGEGTFHQTHQGAYTSRRFGRREANAEYEALRGEPFSRPPNEPLYLGTVPPEVVPHLLRAAQCVQDAGDPAP